MTAFVVGFVIEEQERLQSERSDPRRYSLEVRSRAVGADAPLVAAAGATLHRAGEAHFEELLEVVLAGIGATLLAWAGSGVPMWTAGAARVAEPRLGTVFTTMKPVPALERPDLLPAAVAAAVAAYVPQTLVFEVDPDHADTETLCAVYHLPLEVMANAVLVQGRRGGEERQACCLTLAHRRVDVNNVVRRRLDVRKASFAPMEVAVAASGMEYGGITPVGLPADWPVWVDAAVADTDLVCIGAGIRGAKLLLPGETLLDLPGAERVEGLARDVG